jgi:hypothetical protein
MARLDRRHSEQDGQTDVARHILVIVPAASRTDARISVNTANAPALISSELKHTRYGAVRQWLATGVRCSAASPSANPSPTPAAVAGNMLLCNCGCRNRTSAMAASSPPRRPRQDKCCGAQSMTTFARPFCHCIPYVCHTKSQVPIGRGPANVSTYPSIPRSTKTFTCSVPFM